MNTQISRAPSSLPPDDIIDLAQVAKSLGQKKWRILLTAIVAGLVSTVAVYLLRDTYESKSLIIMESGQASPSFSIPSFMPRMGSSSAETEATIMTSRTVLINAIHQGDLTKYIEPAPRRLGDIFAAFKSIPERAGESSAERTQELQLTSFDVPRDFIGKEVEVQYQGNGRFIAKFPNGAEVEGAMDIPISPAPTGPSLTISKIAAMPGDTFILRRDTIEDTLLRIKRNISVEEIGKTGIVELSYRGHSPQPVHEVLSSIVQSYLTSDDLNAVNKAQQSLDYIESQIGPALKAIEGAEEALTAYRKESETVNVEFEAQYLLQQMLEVEQRLRENQRPAERQTLESFRNDYKAALAALPDTQQQTQNLTRDIEVAQILYLEQMKRVQDARAYRISAHGIARLIDEPYLPTRPNGPNRTLLLLILVASAVAVHAMIVALGATRRQA